MPQYTYKAKAGPAEIKSGTIQADNQSAVVRKLREEGLYPVSIAETNPETKKRSSRKIRTQEVAAFTRQLSNLTRSGFPLASALGTLAQQAQSQSLKRVVQELQDNILKGVTFSDALARYPRLFSSFYINMVKIGETSGKIDETLERLADFKEREDELNAQVRSALTYPAFLLGVGLLSIFLLLTFFMPRLVNMFSDLEQTLPLATQILIGIGTFMNKFWWLVTFGLGLGIFLAYKYYTQEKNRIVFDGFLLRLPVVNGIIQRIEIARFAYALGMLLKNGVPVLESLDVVTLSVDNRLFRKRLSGFPDKIRKGASLSSCLQKEPIFPVLLTNMVAVGEESGELTEMLFRIAQTFETEVSRNVKTLVSLIEPMLILFIGGIVVVMVIAILLPIFQMDFFTR